MIGVPSSSAIMPPGTVEPSRWANVCVPCALAEVEPSYRKGCSSLAGAAKAIGFVPKRGSAPKETGESALATPGEDAFDPRIRDLVTLATRVGEQPPAGGNDVTLLRDAERTFLALSLAIEAAESHVHLEYYIFKAAGKIEGVFYRLGFPEVIENEFKIFLFNIFVLDESLDFIFHGQVAVLIQV